MSHHLTYAEAVITGLIQGVTELFPVSSLGHNVLIPALIGGQWAAALNVSVPNSPYLAFVVGLHVATAVALRIVRGFLSSVRRRQIVTADERLAWMIILATIPVGIVGAALQKVFTHVFAKPELTALFLAANGLILLYSERQRRARAEAASPGAPAAPVAVPAGGPAAGPGRGGYEGYSQQPWQQQWQGPDPRYGQDDWQHDRGSRHGRDDFARDDAFRRDAYRQNDYDQDGYGQDGQDGYAQGGHGQGGQDGYGQGGHGQDSRGGRDPWGEQAAQQPDPRAGRGSRHRQDAWAAQAPWDSAQDPWASQDQRRRQDTPTDGDPWGQRGARDARNAQDMTARAPRDGGQAPWDGGQAPWDGLDPWESQEPQRARQSRAVRDPRGAQDPRAGRDPRGARDPRGSRDGRPARHAAAALEWDDRQPPRRAGDQTQDESDHAVAADRRLSMMGYAQAVLVGSAQILALLPGISRDGIVTVTGMWRGLSREDAVRYSFLLSAPVILAAGALKAQDLVGPMGKGIHGPVLVGSVLSGIGAYLSVRFLTRYFSEDRSLNPFGIYCLIAGLGSFVYLLIK
jgi:undecaprenyl pyrophosphate phosphatase UppP